MKLLHRSRSALILIIILTIGSVTNAQQIELPPIEFSSADELTGLREYLEKNFNEMYREVNDKVMLKYSKQITCIIVPKLSDLEHELEIKLHQPITLKDSIAGVAVKSLSLIILNANAFREQPFQNARQTFKHELTHLMLSSIEQKGELPLWFEEGLCQWSEQLLFYPTFREKDLYASIEGAPSIAQIENKMQRREDLDKAYISAFNSVDFLLTNQSKSRLPEFYFNFSETGNFDKSFEMAFSETVLDFEKRWHKHLVPNVTFRILNFVGANWFTLLFGFAGILAILVYFKRRRRFKKAVKEFEIVDNIEDDEYENSHKWMREIERRRKMQGFPEPNDDEFDPDV